MNPKVILINDEILRLGRPQFKEGYNSSMLPLPDTKAILITSQQQFESLIQQLIKEPKLAVDTESNSLFAYRERVCLIQISTPSDDYLIDPFAVKDLASLAQVFSNPNQQKIFHAAEYDLICLKRDYSFTFSNIFDTMVAARILGETQVGLGSMLKKYFSITLDKRFQRANWGTRPLPPAMLDYARLDTHYLFSLQAHLEDELRQHNLLNLAQEDFAILCDTQPPTIEPNGKSCWKVSGAVQLNGNETAILQALCAYRDQQAQKMDVPHFKVLSNDLLVELCQEKPHTLEELHQVKGMNDRMIKKFGPGLLDAIQQGEISKPLHRPFRSHPDEQFMARLEALKDWRKKCAREKKIESDVVLPKDLMESIACRNPKNAVDLQVVMQKTPWRFNHYGISILRELSALEKK